MIFNIPFSDILFYIVAVFMIFAALLAVVSKNILRNAIFLIATFIGTAVLYLMLQSEFMAMAQIMLYVGGVVVFIIFAILLTSRLGEDYLSTPKSQKIGALFLAMTFLAITLNFLIQNSNLLKNVSNATPADSSLSAYGIRLLSYAPDGFLLSFEIISILLFMTLVIAITIAKKDDKEEK